MSGHRADRMYLLQYGAERVSAALSLRGGPVERHYWESFVGVLVRGGDEWILFDTEMARAALDSPAVQAAYAAGDNGDDDFRWHLTPTPPADRRWTWGLAGDPLAAALATVGLTPEQISRAVVSHLHVDHAGGIPTLAAHGVPVAAHRDELAFARSGAVGVTAGFHPPDWSHPGTRWELLDGDTDLAPGVRVLSTPGHTPGHLSLRVDLPETGTWLFAADAADLGQNFLDRTPCGSCAAARPGDEELADRSLDRLLREAADSDARIVPGHDQLVLNAVRHPPGGHR
ncbi:N-acyl homoserine lactonase family protein [Micromonospora sp. NPDC050980]|uniref:N-acyl homoserine lactonase family protein n=1 Tax=Micromonospora sp. NPDC050980 TaxID=3155161 RepID=UPI0034016EC6